jgi:hypothetical protein
MRITIEYRWASTLIEFRHAKITVLIAFVTRENFQITNKREYKRQTNDNGSCSNVELCLHLSLLFLLSSIFRYFFVFLRLSLLHAITLFWMRICLIIRTICTCTYDVYSSYPPFFFLFSSLFSSDSFSFAFSALLAYICFSAYTLSSCETKQKEKKKKKESREMVDESDSFYSMLYSICILHIRHTTMRHASYTS